LEAAGRKGLDFYFGCPTGLLACSRPFVDGGWVFGNFDIALARSVFDSKVQDGKASVPEDQEMLLDFFEKRGDDGCQRLTTQLHRCVAGTILRAAALDGRTEEIQRVCGISGLGVNNESMRGALGETCLHVAAAVGSLDVMRALLRAQVDPNSEDRIRERPLHYAAFAGQLAAAELLLKHGAELQAENSFRETALEVAEQDPAAFLGGSAAAEVAALLRTAALPPIPEHDESSHQGAATPTLSANRAKLDIPKLVDRKIQLEADIAALQAKLTELTDKN